MSVYSTLARESHFPNEHPRPVPRDGRAPARLTRWRWEHLPYGVYYSGLTPILFNRRYQPIAYLSSQGWRPCEPFWVQIDEQCWFYKGYEVRDERALVKRLEALCDELGYRP